eukprot:gnl/TRDRNA2_/TRDRNA2_191724_c0_seq1.p1 gnl/TRDRNA2_/TRDRNA2_191724_c0~~gnl/TRDRNA2_/TRDRNA2_191724_c0_seq1.p1  ORF type:complete len:132 (+),score=18.18 gnl/TRDRNA2_/TRDRNA2_191724_c0_seq1:49-444(+)
MAQDLMRRPVLVLLLIALVVEAVPPSLRKAVRPAALLANVTLGEPNGAGQVEDSMADACKECAEHAPYLDSNGEECICHATNLHDNNTSLALTNRSNHSMAVNKTGARSSGDGWTWHCRPVTDTEGVWKKC